MCIDVFNNSNFIFKRTPINLLSPVLSLIIKEPRACIPKCLDMPRECALITAVVAFFLQKIKLKSGVQIRKCKSFLELVLVSISIIFCQSKMWSNVQTTYELVLSRVIWAFFGGELLRKRRTQPGQCFVEGAIKHTNLSYSQVRHKSSF